MSHNYRVSRKPEYGEIKHQSLDELRAGARVEKDEEKENVLDFALWKAAKPEEPNWPSPWVQGDRAGMMRPLSVRTNRLVPYSPVRISFRRSGR